MLRVADAPDVPDDVRRAMVETERAIESRLGYRCAYNKRTGELFVYLRDMAYGVYSWPVRRKYGVGVAPKTEDVIGVLQTGKMSRHRKRLAMQYAAQSAKSRNAAELERWMSDRRSSAMDHASYLLQKREMGGKWRKSAVVSGAKEP